VGRASLFTGFVRCVLRREHEAEHPLVQPDALLDALDVTRLTQGLWGTPYALPERGPLLPRLSALAWQMQRQRRADEAGQVRIAYDEAITLLDHPLYSGGDRGLEQTTGTAERSRSASWYGDGLGRSPVASCGL
jgi:hypothetical protein